MKAPGRRTCYVSPAGRIGGGEVSLLHLVRNLSHTRQPPAVICYAEGDLVDALREIGVDVRVIERGSRLSEAALIGRLVRLFRSERVGLVHVNTLDIRAGIAARLAGCRLVGHLRVIFPTTWVDRLFVRLSDRTIAVSEAARRAFSAGNSGIYRKFARIPNGVYIECPPPPTADLTSELDLPQEARLIGAVGRLDPVKGIEHLIAAAPQVLRCIPEARFLVVGRPGDLESERRYAQELRERVRRLNLGDRFFFLGHRTDPLSVIAGLDILAVPSVELGPPARRRAEGFGRVAAEAMAVGTPVVAGRTGGLPEVLGGGAAGLLVPGADPDALARALLRLLRDTALRERLIRAGRRRFERCFTISRHVGEVENLYARIV